MALDPSDIPRPRNALLYRASHWIYDDLVEDLVLPESFSIPKDGLNPEKDSFLADLAWCVFILFEVLLLDLAKSSTLIQQQVDGSRAYALDRNAA